MIEIAARFTVHHNSITILYSRDTNTMFKKLPRDTEIMRVALYVAIPRTLYNEEETEMLDRLSTNH